MKKQPANRVAALGAAVTAVAAGVVSVLGAVDSGPKAAVVIAALVVLGAVAVVFLLGAQKHEARAKPAPVQPVSVSYSGSNVTWAPEPDPEFKPDPAPPAGDPSVAQAALDGGAA